MGGVLNQYIQNPLKASERAMNGELNILCGWLLGCWMTSFGPGFKTPRQTDLSASPRRKMHPTTCSF